MNCHLRHVPPARVTLAAREWTFPDGHSVIILSEGRLLNLGNATGRPSFVMPCSLANQVPVDGPYKPLSLLKGDRTHEILAGHTTN